MSSTSVFQTILNLVAPTSRKLGIERFVDAAAAVVGATESTGTTTSPVTGATVPAASNSKDSGFIWVIISLLLWIALMIAYSAGAARLSWCYNKYQGNDSGISIFYAVLAYMFSGFYYPYYAWFLNPACSLRMAPPTIAGGRRRH